MAIPKDEEKQKRVKRRARAVLTTPSSRPIEPKTKRKKTKYKKPPGEES
ncbi:MAG: hypothetical protein NTY38_14255 [Acidobacteria bacterium]|nr:hypothetical protein [Acidobacteriota bacterium]